MRTQLEAPRRGFASLILTRHCCSWSLAVAVAEAALEAVENGVVVVVFAAAAGLLAAVVASGPHKSSRILALACGSLVESALGWRMAWVGGWAGQRRIAMRLTVQES